MHSKGVFVRENHQRTPLDGLGGHLTRDKTIEMVANRHYWPKMFKEVDILMRRSTCQFSKDSSQNMRLYTPLPESETS